MPTIPPPITTTFPSAFASPSRTACESTTNALSFPGIGGTIGAAPIALINVCGLISAIISGVTFVFIRMSTPRRFAFSAIDRTAAFISAFLGASPAVRNWPPSVSVASQRIGLCPLFFRMIAASSPPIPPPAIRTVSGFSAGMSSHSFSLPTAGLRRQVMHGESLLSNPS